MPRGGGGGGGGAWTVGVVDLPAMVPGVAIVAMRFGLLRAVGVSVVRTVGVDPARV